MATECLVTYARRKKKRGGGGDKGGREKENKGKRIRIGWKEQGAFLSSIVIFS